MTILVVGYNAHDVTVAMSGLPDSDTKTEVSLICESGGGPAATAAVALARLGAAVRLITVFGDDEPSRRHQAELRDAGIDLSWCRRAVGRASPRAVILVDPRRGHRTIFWTRGTLPMLPADAVAREWLDGVDLLYCDGHECAAASRLAGWAGGRGIPVVLDGGSVRAGAETLVARCSDVISSRTFAPALTGQDEPLAALRALRERGPRRVALTAGEAGCLALVDDALVHVPAFAVPVRDTTGAGDVFHAGYAYALLQGRDFLGSLAFASAAAALKCRDWGGRRGLPTLAEIEALLRDGARRADRPG